VWNESIRQAQEVLQHWTSQADPIFETAKHVRTLSLHVLSSAGFGKSYSFHKAAEAPKPGHMFNYRDSLSMILDHIMLILVVGPNFLTSRFLPKQWSRIGQAIIDFKAYMKDMYIEEKKSISGGNPCTTNIMTSLIRASAAADGPEKGQKSFLNKGNSRGLSESEIYGNTFVYNFAGHDTTAITLGWTIYLLAAHPEVQDWIAGEIQEHLRDRDVSACGYSEVFPKLKRCHAVLVSPCPWLKTSCRILEVTLLTWHYSSRCSAYTILSRGS
jgi:cytochrome P450